MYDCLSDNVEKISSSETDIAEQGEIAQRVEDTTKKECISWVENQFGTDSRALKPQTPMPLARGLVGDWAEGRSVDVWPGGERVKVAKRRCRRLELDEALRPQRSVLLRAGGEGPSTRLIRSSQSGKEIRPH